MDRSEHGKAREGRLTSSLAVRLMAGYPNPARPLKSWNTLLRDIRNPRPFFDLGPNTPAPLAWGTTHEPRAAAVFWDRHPEFDVHDPRFVRYHDPDHPLLYPYAGDSPDRMISLAGSAEWIAPLELKCPYQQEIHWGYLKARKIPAEYKAQCYWHMMVTGLPQVYFASYDPRMTDPDHQYFEILVRQDEDSAYAAAMLDRAVAFLEVLDSGDVFELPKTTSTSVRSMFT